MTPPPVAEPDAGLNAAVAAEIRAEMARRKLTVRQLAELADIPYGTLRRKMSAERYIDVAELEQIAAALELTSVEIVEAAERRVPRAVDELSERRESASEVYAEETKAAARRPGRAPSLTDEPIE